MGKSRALLVVQTLVIALSLGGCSSGKKKTTPELGKLEGKKVALVEVEGETTPRKIVEVALINQLIQKGSFILVSKQDVETARRAPAQDPNDWQGIARRAGADLALRARVIQFDADTREGYSSEEVEDSQLAAERGKDKGKDTRYFKAKSLTGKVQVELEFTQLDNGEARRAIATHEETVTADAKSSAIHLPPKLRFLEKISNEAFRDFFDRYN